MTESQVSQYYQDTMHESPSNSATLESRERLRELKKIWRVENSPSGGSFSFQAFMKPRSYNTFFPAASFSMRKLDAGMSMTSCPAIGDWIIIVVGATALPASKIETRTVNPLYVGS